MLPPSLLTPTVKLPNKTRHQSDWDILYVLALISLVAEGHSRG